jgi:hypothetical protein
MTASLVGSEGLGGVEDGQVISDGDHLVGWAHGACTAGLR